jgi:serine phosphatase RsbU (regulator of sigma subunit)/anti-sigma regulatory factor (Ser/Thr protein kinase)
MAATAIQRVRGSSLRLTVACDFAAVRQAAQEARAFLQEHEVAPDEIAACELVLAEACNNAVQHATPSGRDLPLGVELICDGESLEFRIEDHTAGFDWPAAVALPEETSERGRGLFLMRSLTDQAAYLRAAGGNCLVLRKNRKPNRRNERDAERTRELASRLAESERIIRDMAEELSSCYESLSAIFRYGAEQSRVWSIDDFARKLLGDLLRVTGTEWYVFRLFDTEARRLTLFAASGADIPPAPLPLPEEASDADPVETQAAVQQRDRWLDAEQRPATADPLSVPAANASCMIHPVCLGDSLIGTLAVGRRGLDRRLTAAGMNIVQTLGDFLAIQIVNTRFREEQLRNLLVARELDIARNIQRSLLPAVIPQPEGMRLVGYCESAREVGGDLYDVIRLSNGATLLMIGDVMGKGLPAAMFAIILRSLIRALRDDGVQPGRLLRKVNELLHEELSRLDTFITAQVLYFDPDARRMVVANAGHCPVLFCAAPGDPVQVVSPDGLPLGVESGVEFSEISLPLGPEARCLLFTDGLTETVQSAGEMFGQQRLAHWLFEAAAARQDAETMKQGLIAVLQAFQQNEMLRDDQTFLILAGQPDSPNG